MQSMNSGTALMHVGRDCDKVEGEERKMNNYWVCGSVYSLDKSPKTKALLSTF